MAEHSCIVNVVNRVELWGGVSARETLKFLEVCLGKVKERIIEMLNKIFQYSSFNLSSELC